MRNEVVLKTVGMSYVKMHGFHGNLLYDSREWGIGLLIKWYLEFYLYKSTEIA